MSASAVIGRPVAELATPVAVVDLDAHERNVARVAAHAADRGLALHPHVKTHKTAPIARGQLAAGAAGLTVAKPGEALAFADAGFETLLLHYPVVGPEACAAVARLAERVALTVALDSLAAAEPLARALRTRGASADLLIELDVGMRRTGVDPGGALALAQAVERLGGGLRLRGISCYPGHVRGEAAAVEAGLAAVDALLEEARERFAAAGLACERVSGGSTATVFAARRTPLTELRPGNYVFLDRREAVGAWSPEDCALHVHATVVSTSVPGRIVLDAGAKTLSEAPAPPGLRGFGAIVGAPEVTIAALNEEHAICDVPPGSRSWQVGDRVAIVPNHACTCANLHDALVAARGGVVEDVVALIARGAVR